MSENVIRERILIVDDDRIVLNNLKIQLNELGYETIQASGAHEAMSIILKLEVSLVISDMNMPDGDGLDLLRFLKVERPKIPFVLMTSLNTLLEAHEATVKGANYFLAKPFKQEELRNAVNSCLFDCGRGSKKHEELVRVYIGNFIGDDAIKCDVYLRLDKSKFIKVAQKGDDISHEEVSQYRQKGIHSLYILKSELKKNLNLPTTFDCQQSESIKKRKQAIFKEMTFLLNEVLEFRSLNKEAFFQAEILLESTLSLLVDHDQVFALFEKHSLGSKEALRKGLFIGFYSVLISQYLSNPTAKKYFLLAASGLLHDLEGEESLSIASGPALCHPERRAMVLMEMNSLPLDIVTIILQHHEKETGKGYPRGLISSEIHPLAKIMGVADELYHRLKEKEISTENLILSLNEMAKACLNDFNLKVIEALILAFNQPIPFEMVQYQLSEE